MATREEYLPILEWFFNKVDNKLALPKNVAKRHWSECGDRLLLDQLVEEVKELRDALAGGYASECTTEPNATSIILECADIAAFAMMIADNHRTEYYDKSRE